MRSIPSRPVHVSGFVFALALSAASATAQCLEWAPDDGVRGTGVAPGTVATGDVFAMTHWDPDGAGPASARVVVVGDFTIAGDVLANRVATYDPSSGDWSGVGGGTNGIVHAVVALPTGELVVAGEFTMAGGVAASRVAHWNGTTWSPLGAGFGNVVRCLAVTSAGELFAGGDFTNSGATQVPHLARWNGVTWTPVGGGTGGPVHSLLPLPNDELAVGGAFAMAGGTPAANIARWDGVTWSPYAQGTGGRVQALARTPNGDLYAGGLFVDAGPPVFHVTRWTGTSWAPLQQGVGGIIYDLFQVQALAAAPNGDLFVGGRFTLASGVEANRVARWDGSAWQGLGTGANDAVRALLPLANGDLLVGGEFTRLGGVPAHFLGRWDGSAWSAVQQQFDDEVLALATSPGGDLFAGGRFRWSPGGMAARIARFDGTDWSPLGAGLDGVVRAVAVLPNGDLVAGGDFTMAGGVAASRIARWDGQAWFPMGAGFDGAVDCLLATSNGDLFAGGVFTASGGVPMPLIARWDGVMWSALAPMPGSAMFSVLCLTELANGDLAVGGYGSHVLRWDGAAWSPIGGNISLLSASPVYAPARVPHGELVAGGYQLRTPSLALPDTIVWDGVEWRPFTPIPSANEVRALATLANGDLVRGRDRLQRWDGTSWSAVGLQPTIGHSRVHAIARIGTGLAVGGVSATVPILATQGAVTRLDTNCPALATVTAAGCASSGGSNTLVATSLPWVETTFRATGTGLPNLAVVVAVTGIGAIPTGLAPLGAVFGQGQPGCFVLVTPDILQPLVTTTGTAQSDLFLPRSGALVGVTFHHQMIPFEIDASGGFVAITATNSLQLVGGDY